LYCIPSGGADYYTINPKGNVPALVLDDGTLINEGAAVLQWIADQRPGSVAPVNGTTARLLVQQALNYTASEVHGTVAHLFNKTISAGVRAYLVTLYKKKLTYTNDKLVGGKDFLVGSSFTIADSYLYIVLSWCPYVGIDLTEFPNLVKYTDKLNKHPKVSDQPNKCHIPPF
jgi:glutathione S-transferase